MFGWRAGITADNDAWIAVAAVVERFGHSSMYLRRRYEVDGTTFERRPGTSRPAQRRHGGRVPALVVLGTGSGGRRPRLEKEKRLPQARTTR